MSPVALVRPELRRARRVRLRIEQRSARSAASVLRLGSGGAWRAPESIVDLPKAKIAAAVGVLAVDGSRVVARLVHRQARALGGGSGLACELRRVEEEPLRGGALWADSGVVFLAEVGGAVGLYVHEFMIFFIKEEKRK